MRLSRERRALLLVLLLCAVPAPVAAQAMLSGVVRHAESGAPLGGARVSLTDLDRTSVTGGDGRYVLLGVPSGPVHVTVRAIGFFPRTLHALVPATGSLEIDIAIRVVPHPLPEVAVRATPATNVLDGGAQNPSERTRTAANVLSDPRLGEPDVLQSLSGGALAIRPEAPSGVHLRGGAADQTAFQLDGIPILSPYHGAGVTSALNADVIGAVHLASAAPAPSLPPTLSGTIEAETRRPGSAMRWQGGLSTSQARLSLDGPLGGRGRSILLAARTGYPAAVAPGRETSYLRGGTRDMVARLESPLLGGEARLLYFAAHNDLDAIAAVAGDTTTGRVGARNAFEWSTQSLGGTWLRRHAASTLRLTAWSATSRASAEWVGRDGPATLDALREDLGLVAALDRRTRRAVTTVGTRIERMRSQYRFAPDTALSIAGGRDATTIVGTIFAQQDRPFGDHATLNLAAGLAHEGSEWWLSPRAQLRWRIDDRLEWALSLARTHQFMQSMRNTESVVGAVFPPDLSVGAADEGVPVARSDQGVFALVFRSRSGLRLTAEAFARRLDQLVLVAPVEGEPFATTGFAVGSGSARGIALDLERTGARHLLIGHYAIQRVRLNANGIAYTPEHGVVHSLEAGITLYPTATTSLRFGGAAALGRRTTVIANGFEWESCNLVDRGCEFGGSPNYDGQPLGGAALPAYLRFDAGFRQHVHLTLWGRDAQVEVFGTFTNLLGRHNLLTYATDPLTGRRAGVEMRRPSPLVVGIDWRF